MTKTKNRNDADRRETSGVSLAAPAYPKAACTHCEGTGQEPLSAHLMNTLDEFTDTGELEAATFHKFKSDCITINAWSNRLRKLYDAGYLLRRKSGKRWLYRRAG